MACKHTWVQALHGVHVIPGDASVGTLQECSNLSIMMSFICKHSTQDKVIIIESALQQPLHLQHEVPRRRSAPDEPQDKAPGENQRGVQNRGAGE